MMDFFLEGTDTISSNQYMIGGVSGANNSQPPPMPSVKSTEKAAPASGGGSGEISKIMTQIGGLMSPEIVKSTNAVFQFEVKGKLKLNITQRDCIVSLCV